MNRKFILKINLLVILFIASIVVIYKKLNFMYNVFIIIIICLLLFSELIKNFNLSRRISFKIKESCMVSLFIFCCFLSTIYNFSLTNTGKLLIIFLMVPITIIIVIKYGYEYIVKFLKASLNFVVLFNFVGIYEILSKKNIFFEFLSESLQGDKISFQTTYGYDEFRVYSAFGHPIIYGNILVVFFFICILLEKSTYKKIVFSSVILMNLYFTKSRSSWLAFFVILILYLINRIIYNNKNNKKLKLKVNYIIAFDFITILVSFLLYKSGVIKKIYERFMLIELGDGSKIQRVVTIGNIINNWINSNWFIKLFGNGYDTVKDFMMNNQVLMQGFQYTDNQYMTMLYEFGVISVVIYIIILIFYIKKIIFTENKFEILMSIIFISISINMFFYECFAWKPIIMLLILSLTLLCLKFTNNINEEI
ncbi:O-antigen ligase family protein [Clostridium felsineum]|uniref:O-antigen ligase family protein n=1 Tax=Clostridium felsineum TaxID=36839 RepID=UPI00098BD0BD|nr:O-antigen ligase family protein [Clostridium felsineum]URZ14841.1 hypothetical protein CLFE_008540 [Clostridium felsineum DSM 794]